MTQPTNAPRRRLPRWLLVVPMVVGIVGVIALGLATTVASVVSCGGINVPVGHPEVPEPPPAPTEIAHAPAEPTPKPAEIARAP